ncbi:hypothetical protein J1614_001215 [Plenodomus biglobosus]|nr:hypothetical protein J1614_001215 [Plenodomus biglobosus]
MADENAIEMLEGSFTHDQVVYMATEHFREAFDLILEWTDVPWEPVDKSRVGFSEHSLFLGYIKIDGFVYKVSAYLTAAGKVQLCVPGMILSRADFADIEFASFWRSLSHSGEQLRRLHERKTLCQYYFLSTGHLDSLEARKGWFGVFKKACEAVGDETEACPREEGAGGVDEERMSSILQRLLGNHRGARPDWAKKMEEEVAAAWPNYRKNWK